MRQDIDYNQYFLFKMALAILYYPDNNLEAAIPGAFDIDVLEVLKIVVEAYTEDCRLSNNIKQNIYNLALKGREIKDENYVERCNLLNELIIMANSQISDEHIIFYREVLIEKTRDRKCVSYLNDFQIDEMEENIRYMVFTDYALLLATSESIPNKIFEEDFLPSFIESDENVIEAINSVINEYPAILKNDVCRNRIKIIIEANKNSKKYLNKISKLYLKKYKRL